jgi:hypothetical protein
LTEVLDLRSKPGPPAAPAPGGPGPTPGGLLWSELLADRVRATAVTTRGRGGALLAAVAAVVTNPGSSAGGDSGRCCDELGGRSGVTGDAARAGAARVDDDGMGDS